jgi:hypothetical protein
LILILPIVGGLGRCAVLPLGNGLAEAPVGPAVVTTDSNQTLPVLISKVPSVVSYHIWPSTGEVGAVVLTVVADEVVDALQLEPFQAQVFEPKV